MSSASVVSPSPNLLAMIGRLLTWAERTGGWSAPVWREAARLERRANAKRPCVAQGEAESVLSELLEWAAMMGGWEAEVWQEAAEALAIAQGRDPLDL